MSSETLPKIESGSSSRTNSTRCINAEPTDSPTDSLNSLLDDGSNKDPPNCIDVKSLANQCPTSCDNMNSKLEKRSSICCNAVSQCVWGILLLTISISGVIFTPLDVMLWEKMNMRPGFPPYEWWADPPDEVKLRVYVFNVTNHERFLKGEDLKIDVNEIGPIVYLEKLKHSNIRFNENSTMTYTAQRYPIYLPDQNKVDLNATIIVPNLAVLGISSYLHSSNMFVKSMFRLLVNTHGSELFLKKTIYEYLWEYKEPVLDTSKNLAPGLVPVDNMGMLARIYSDFTDEVTVKVGPTWGHHNFFQIDRFRGQPQLPGYDADKCPDRIFGSTEGVMYSQHLSKQDVLLYWRKTVCKLMPLYFDTEMTVDNVPLYRYNLSESVYERVSNSTDCYDTNPSLPSGISDGSKCYFNFPMVISYPHFYAGGLAKDRFVTGLKPDRYKHNSYVVVEPLSGTPFRSVARMQSNLRIHDISDFGGDYATFANHIIPLFWAEYNQEGLPDHIRTMIYFMVVILPPVSYVFLTSLFILGSYLIGKHICKSKLSNDRLKSLLHFKSKNASLTKNKIFTYERETFLKISS